MTDNNDKYIYFYNNTHLPIMIEAWVDGSCELKRKKIDSGEKQLVHSSVGEWHLSSLFKERTDLHDWDYNFGKNSMGYTKYSYIGKFRSKPCYFGNYSWMEYEEPFQCVYSKEKPDINGINGLITYSLINQDKPFVLK